MKTLLQKLVIIGIFINLHFPIQQAHAQCGAGYTTAAINWDFQFFMPTNLPSSPLNFMFGKSSMRFAWTGTNTLRGTTSEHTGQGTSFGTNDDIKFIVGNGADTLVFNKEVTNVKFSIYDLDNGQAVNVTAKNAAGTLQTITMVKDSTAGTTPTIAGSGGTSATATGPGSDINLSARAGTANITIAGPVQTVIMTFTKSSGSDSIYVSDITACNNNTTTGVWATNYQTVSTPEAGQPNTVLTSYGDSIMVVDITNNTASLLYADASLPSINSLAYDPYRQVVYYTDNTRVATNKSIYKYDVKTGTRSVWVADATTLGMQLYSFGLGSGGAGFYDGSLFLGQDVGLAATLEPETVYRIDIDASGNATKAYRFWSKIATNGTSFLYDWSDFVMNNGIFYNFNNGAAMVARTGVMHFNLNTMDTIVGYTTSVRSQLSIDYNGNIYHMTTGGRELYNGAGGFGTLVSYTGIGASVISDGAESFKYPYDFSDAPSGYGAAFHKYSTSPKLMLGTTIDYEVNDTTNVTADADDNYNTGAANDEDGKISFPAISTAWYSYSITVRVTNTTGANATLYGYIDFNRDGDFLDAGERSAATTVPNAATTATVTWTGLTGGSVGSSFIRFRLASSAAEAGSPSGYAANGEVEDYPFPINQVNLPVEMVEFKGELRQDKTTLLTWSTASEMNNDYFDVQRKNAEGIWESLGQVQGSGNSNQLRTYTFIDKAPLTGENYYRLNQVDFGGKSELSSTIMVKLEEAVTDKKDDYIVYPNPVRNDIWIKADQNIAAGTEIPLEVFNVTGDKVYAATMKENLFRMDLTQFQKGMYFIRIGNKSYRILKE